MDSIPDHRLLPILLVHDGKPGHRAQAEGLATALAHLREAVCWEYDIGNRQRFPHMEEPPKIVVSVGRQSAGEALRQAKRFGAKSVALMNPGWWKRRKFDLCVVPKHDGLKAAQNLIVTYGALSTSAPAPQAPMEQGLVLIGGPSAHHGWSEAKLMDQLEGLLENTPDIRAFTATSSRRTPKETEAQLRRLSDESEGRFNFTPSSDTPRGWVSRKLAECGTCWVTEDSVSMVYEALSAGVATGLLDVPRKTDWRGRPGRVVRGVMGLAQDGLVVPFKAWRDGTPLRKHPPLNEALRVADAMLKKWPEV